MKTKLMQLAAIMFVLMILFSVSIAWGDVVPLPKVYTLDANYLITAKKELAQSNSTLKPALNQLIKEADEALKLAPMSVLDKKLIPPNGDKHNYMSIAPYWWPDPSKPNGLPYIRKDGKTNPESKNEATDKRRKEVLFKAVDTLSLAYYFTGNIKYAEHAGKLIKTWFIDPKTKMNPNLQYSQAVPGVVDGRGIGIIDFSTVYKIIDSIGLLEEAKVFSSQDKASLINWFKSFNNWLLTSQHGREERNWHNNHGSWYDVIVVDIALFTGDLNLAKITLEDAQYRRFAAHIAIDGKLHAELERTRPSHYSMFDLQALMFLARYGEQVDMDLWNFVQDGRSLRKAIDYLAFYVDKPAEWQYKEFNGFAIEEMLPILLQAHRAYKDAKYSKLLKFMPESTIADRNRLLWPISKNL